MLVIESTQPLDDVAPLLEAQGYKPIEAETPAPKEEAQPKIETNSELTEKPGSESSAAPDGKIATVTDPVETKKQEAKQEPKPETTEEAAVAETAAKAEQNKAKGGYQAKVEKLTKQLDAARDSLELERGDKGKLQGRIDELQAQLDTLSKPAAEPKAEELVKPKRPLLKDFDGDYDKYEAALGVHEDALSEYHGKVAKAEVDRQLKAAEEGRRHAETEAEAQRALVDFHSRLDKGKALYEDFDELITDNPRLAPSTGDVVTLVDLDEDAGVTKGFIGESDNPSHVMRYLALDALNNNHAETIRLLSLNPIKRLKELTRIENELAAAFETTPKKETAESSKVVEPVKESVAPPAKPEAHKPIQAPLKTVGTRAGGLPPSYQELSERDPKGFMKSILSGLEKKKAGSG